MIRYLKRQAKRWGNSIVTPALILSLKEDKE
jgi:hypothetical protein